MGNDYNKDRPEENYSKTTHLGLKHCQYDKQEQLLYTVAKVESSFTCWRKDIEPLLQSRYLFVPSKIIGHDIVNEVGCCAQQNLNYPSIQFKKVFYLPYFFTLEKEIVARQELKKIFREQQLWKMISYMGKAVQQWQEVYPQQKLGVICPRHLRIVCKLSFLSYQYGPDSDLYLPPQSRNNSIIKYSLNPHRDPVGIEASLVYNIGIVLLQVATLSLANPSFIKEEKQQVLVSSKQYSQPLKQTIFGMLDTNQSTRPTVKQLLHQARTNKNRRIL